MTQYISKDDAIAEIKRRIKFVEKRLERNNSYSEKGSAAWERDKALYDAYNSLLSSLDTLEVKESKLPNPRFPHLNNIVDKVFGTGNLESLEYEEAEQLVLLAKEELLKDLEVKEVDLEKELDSMITPELKLHKALPSLFDVAKHFFELGIKAQKGDNE